MPRDAYYTGYPHHLITSALIQEIHKLNHEQGQDAALAHFRQAVGGDPWFQSPERSNSGFSRLETEFMIYLTDEHIVEFPE